MNLMNMIKQRVSDRCLPEVVIAMGYRSNCVGLATLEAFLGCDSIELWLKTAHYDFKYSSEEFLFALCRVLEIAHEIVAKDVGVFRDKSNVLRQMVQPYVFIETNFRRTNEPIIALAMMEHKRRIFLDKEAFVFLSLTQSLQKIGKMVRQHYVTSNGDALIWGKILHYCFHHTDGRVYVFDVHGVVLPCEPKSESCATLML